MIIFKFTFSNKYISILNVNLQLSRSSIWFQGKLDRFNNTSKQRIFHVHSFLGIWNHYGTSMYMAFLI